MKGILGLCLVLSVIFVFSPAWAQGTLLLYDDFQTPTLSPDKWFSSLEPDGILEASIGISSSAPRLVIQNRAYGETDIDSGRLRGTLSLQFTGGAAVTAIQAKVRVEDFEIVGCPTNNDPPTVAFARLAGDFFNAGTVPPTDGDATNDVFARIGIEGSSTTDPPVLYVLGSVHLCTNKDCTTTTEIGSARLGGTIATRRFVTLTIWWEQGNKVFGFRRDNVPTTFIPYTETEMYPPGRPVQGLSVLHFVANCIPTGDPRPTAFMKAVFDDVYVNESAVP